MLKKVKTVDELKPLIAILRATGKKIVFTNGCFDLIHTGHTRYLAQAKSCGDVLIVAINSDASVRGIKGEKRPINSEGDRAETLAALEPVDFVTIFSEPDPYKVILELQPDVLVKGGDWPVDKIVGRDVVEARGGKVISVVPAERSIAHRIIEEFMLLANECVAEKLFSSGGPALYRVHEAPDPLKVEEFAEFALTLGYKLEKQDGPYRPKDFQKFILKPAVGYWLPCRSLTVPIVGEILVVFLRSFAWLCV